MAFSLQTVMSCRNQRNHGRIKEALLVSQGDVLIEEHQDAHLVSGHVEFMLGLGHLGLVAESSVLKQGGCCTLKQWCDWKIQRLVRFLPAFNLHFQAISRQFPLVCLWFFPWQKHNPWWGFPSLDVCESMLRLPIELSTWRRRCWNHPRISREKLGGSKSWNESGVRFF